jgi:hypothetical protein
MLLFYLGLRGWYSQVVLLDKYLTDYLLCYFYLLARPVTRLHLLLPS